MFNVLNPSDPQSLCLPKNPQREYDHLVNNLGDFHSVICPHCKSAGTMKIHSHYYRHFLPGPGRRSIRLKITVLRCSVKTCRHCHAILPSWICPFCSMSYSFIALILHFYYCSSEQNIQKTALHFALPRSTIRILSERFSFEEASVLETCLAETELYERKRILERLKESVHDFLLFLCDFHHRMACAFMTRHFPPTSFWTRISYGLL